MYYSNVVISYLQANKILAMKLDRAVSGTEQRVSGQVKKIGAGVTRILYYTFCFTDEYQDVCKKQKNEDVREGANKQVISSQADSLIKISRIWADFFPANTSNQPI